MVGGYISKVMTDVKCERVRASGISAQRHEGLAEELQLSQAELQQIDDELQTLQQSCGKADADAGEADRLVREIQQRLDDADVTEMLGTLGEPPDHPAARPGHAHVRDVRRAARQYPRVGGRDVRVRADDRADATGEMPAHRDLLRGRFGVEVYDS